MISIQHQFIANVLNSRFLQIKRLVVTVGFIRFLLLLAVVVIALSYCYQAFEKYPPSILPLCLGITFPIVMLRQDRRFFTLLTQHVSLIFFVEYLLICLPLFILACFTSAWHYLPACWFALFIITRLQNKPSKQSAFSRYKWVHHSNIEWITGLRRNPFIFVAYAMAVFTVFLPYAALIFTWIVLAIISSFYEQNEPLSVLLASNNTAKQFINRKIKQLFCSYFIPVLPVIALYTAFNPQHWYVSMGFVLMNVLCLTSIVFIKYAYYIPNRTPFVARISTMFVMASILVFPLLILTAMICYVSHKRAISTLNFYLHDNN